MNKLDSETLAKLPFYKEFSAEEIKKGYLLYLATMLIDDSKAKGSKTPSRLIIEDITYTSVLPHFIKATRVIDENNYVENTLVYLTQVFLQHEIVSPDHYQRVKPSEIDSERNQANYRALVSVKNNDMLFSYIQLPCTPLLFVFQKLYRGDKFDAFHISASVADSFIKYGDRAIMSSYASLIETVGNYPKTMKNGCETLIDVSLGIQMNPVVVTIAEKALLTLRVTDWGLNKVLKSFLEDVAKDAGFYTTKAQWNYLYKKGFTMDSSNSIIDVMKYLGGSN